MVDRRRELRNEKSALLRGRSFSLLTTNLTDYSLELSCFHIPLSFYHVDVEQRAFYADERYCAVTSPTMTSTSGKTFGIVAASK
jgi:hypothetical protein